MSDAPLDPQLRFQNIALEHSELVARRSMSWAESTNRTTMFMTVVSAAVVGLALFAQTGIAGRSMALLALLILSVVLAIGVTTVLRIGQLDELDMRWIQGLNRLRAVRLEMDPSLEPYIVTSANDDFDSVIGEYVTEGQSPAYAFGTLMALLLVVNAMLVGVIGGLLPAVVLADGYDGLVSVATGVIATTFFTITSGLAVYRSTLSYSSRVKSIVPARPAVDGAAGPTGRVAPAAETQPEAPGSLQRVPPSD
jgi:hypothetical protein